MFEHAGLPCNPYINCGSKSIKRLLRTNYWHLPLSTPDGSHISPSFETCIPVSLKHTRPSCVEEKTFDQVIERQFDNILGSHGKLIFALQFIWVYFAPSFTSTPYTTIPHHLWLLWHMRKGIKFSGPDTIIYQKAYHTPKYIRRIVTFRAYLVSSDAQ